MNHLPWKPVMIQMKIKNLVKCIIIIILSSCIDLDCMVLKYSCTVTLIDSGIHTSRLSDTESLIHNREFQEHGKLTCINRYAHDSYNN